MLKRIIVPILIIVAAIFAYQGLMATKPEKPTITGTEKKWRVATIPVQLQDLAPHITLYGRIETPDKATLKSAIVADVIEADILEGMVVSAGDPLIQLDPTDLHILLAQRRAELAEVAAQIDSELLRIKRDKELLISETKLLELADNAVARANQLEQNNFSSQATVDSAKTDRQRQLLEIKRLRHDINEHPARLALLTAQQKRHKAALAQVKLDLTRAMITAPFSGRVAKLAVAAGDRVQVGDSLLTIYDLAHLEVRAQIPDRYMAAIQTQLAAAINPIATAIVAGKRLTFELVRLSGEIRQDSGGVDGLFRLIDHDQTLALGTFIELKLQLAKQEAVMAIPFDALYEYDRVYRLNKDRLQAVKVTRMGEIETGQGETQLLIRSSELNHSDQIVSTQLPNAITGLKVEAVNE